MGALVTVYSQPATYQAMQLNSYSDMADALNEMLALGYFGNVAVDGNGNWQMWFQSASQNASWNAKLSDWIVVKNNTIVSSVPNAQAAQLYTETPPA